MGALKHYFGLHRANLLGAIKRLAAQPFACLLTILVIASALPLPAHAGVVAGIAAMKRFLATIRRDISWLLEGSGG